MPTQIQPSADLDFARPLSFKPYSLTPLDHAATSLYQHFFLSFLCGNPADGLPILEAGLSKLIARIPSLSGNVSESEQIDRTELVLHPTTTALLQHIPILQIRHHQQCLASSIAYPHVSFDSLPHLDFLPLLDSAASMAPVIRFQANVMMDGIVLGVAFYRSTMGSIGMSTLMEALSDCCRRAGTQFENLVVKPNWWTDESARQQISGAESKSGCSKKTCQTDIATASLMSEHTTSRRFTLSSDRVKDLTEFFNSILFDAIAGTTLSRDDVVTALIWLCGQRARTQATPAEERIDTTSHPSTLGMEIDIRSVLSPPLPASYTGNSTVSTTCAHTMQSETPLHTSTLGLKMQDLSILLELSIQVNQTTNRVDDDYVRDVISQHKSSSPSFPSQPNFSITNLRDLPFTGLNFGSILGNTVNVDIPENTINGLGWILPNVLDEHGKMDADAAWNIRLTLEERAMQCLHQDKLFQWASGMERYKL